MTGRIGRALAPLALLLTLIVSPRGDAAAAQETPRSSGSALTAPSFRAGEEVVALRDRFSRTFVASSGVYRKVTSLSPVNFRDSTGAWQPIDSTLVAAPG